MGKILIIPNANFAENALPFLSVKTAGNVPYYVYYGANIEDEGGNVISGIEGYITLESGINPVSVLSGKGTLLFAGKSFVSGSTETPLTLYNVDRTVNYATTPYSNDKDTLQVLSIPEVILEGSAVRFLSCNSAIEEVDLSGLDFSSASSFRAMFLGCSSLTSIKMPKRNPGKTDVVMTNAFYLCSSLKSIDFGGFDFAGVKDLGSAFRGCSALESLDLSGFDVSSVVWITHTFEGCSSLVSLDLSGWDTSKLQNAIQAFYGCTALAELNVSGWDTRKLTTMSAMFNNCRALESLDLSDWDVSSATMMNNLFVDCQSLVSLNLAGWDFNKVSDYSSWFTRCNSLTTVIGPISNFGKAATTNIGLGATADLDHDSLMVFINGLYDRTGMTKYNLVITSAELARLSAAEIAIATAKNWEITTY